MQESEGGQDSMELPASGPVSEGHETTGPSLEEELEDTKRQLQTIRYQLQENEATLQRRSRQIRDLVMELIFSEQKIRQQVSQVLHDDLQQLLFAAQVQVQFVKQALTPNHETTLIADVQQIKTMLDEALRITRRLTLDFAPSLSQNQNTLSVMEDLAAHMNEWHGLEVKLQINVAEEAMGNELPQFVFQVVRELLFNVVKHAGVRQAQVQVNTEGEQLLIRVIDEGVGFAAAPDWSTSPTEGGYGLRSIHNRVTLFGGQMEIESQPEVGTTVTITLPLPHTD